MLAIVFPLALSLLSAACCVARLVLRRMWECLPPLVRLPRAIYLPPVELAGHRRGVFDATGGIDEGAQAHAHEARTALCQGRERTYPETTYCHDESRSYHVTSHTGREAAHRAQPSSSSHAHRTHSVSAMSHPSLSRPPDTSETIAPLADAAEWCALGEAFHARHRAYVKLKNDFTDAYLTEIERAVDAYLVRYFTGKSVGSGNTHTYALSQTEMNSNNNNNNNNKNNIIITTTAREWSSAALSGLTRAGAATLRQVRDSLLTRGSTWEYDAHAGASDGASNTPINPAGLKEGSFSRDVQGRCCTNNNDNNHESSNHDDININHSNGVGEDDDDEMTRVHRLCYTANVITARYLDEPPSPQAMPCVAANHRILTFVLRHSVPHPPARDETVYNSAVLAAAAAGSHDVRAYAHMREQLMLPTVTHVWRHYLTPLQGKAEELCTIAERHIVPRLSLTRTGGAGAGVADTHEWSGPVSECSRNGAANVLHSAAVCQQRLCQCVVALHRDVDYLRTIRRLDESYAANRDEQWCEEAAGRRGGGHGGGGGGVADYIPVHGLILSRLHRLEVEHRSVLELWSSPSSRTRAQ